MIISKVRDTIKKNHLLDKGDTVLLGLSGGPDSVCLLHILNQLKKELDIKIYAAHLNHKIRGVEAQKDAMYVAKLCDEMGIICFIRAIDVPKYCEEKNLSLEEGARILRYNMFFEIKEKIKADKIAIAHNMDDQAETVLMRMMRGTGLQGLKGIEYKRSDGIIRPILDVYRQEIESYCGENQLNPRIDHTNLEDIYTRNKIRLKLIPYMEENFNPNLKESIARMANLLRDDSDYVDIKANELFLEIGEKLSQNIITLDLEKFLKVHKSLQNRIIRKSIHFILGNIKGIEQKHIEDVMHLAFESKVDLRINLPRGLMVYKKKNEILFTNEELLEKRISYNYKLPKSGYIKIKELNSLVESKIVNVEEVNTYQEDEYTKFFDVDKIYGNLTIRNRKDGDKIKILGLGGNKKIKDLFIDLKIPRENRNKVPILCDEKGIIWVIGYRMSEDYKVDKSTQRILKVTYKSL